jgi:methylmalonyl-CoA mutase C-terminal domain/subunit
MNNVPKRKLAGKRIVVAKPGLDGHDIGAKVIALALRDAGAEVIYTGLRKSPETIARMAIDEDVNAIGLSILSGSHLELVSNTLECMARMGGSDIIVFVGGTIPREDQDKLRAMGVARVFTSEMQLDDVINQVAEALG